MAAQRDPYEAPAIRAFATELEAWRTHARHSKTELAELLGYTPQYVGQIEAAKNIPSEKFARTSTPSSRPTACSTACGSSSTKPATSPPSHPASPTS